MRPAALSAGLAAHAETYWPRPLLPSAGVTPILGQCSFIVGFDQVLIGSRVLAFRKADWFFLPAPVAAQTTCVPGAGPWPPGALTARDAVEDVP